MELKSDLECAGGQRARHRMMGDGREAASRHGAGEGRWEGDAWRREDGREMGDASPGRSGPPPREGWSSDRLVVKPEGSMVSSFLPSSKEEGRT